ncbi:hypothetical protein NEMBOFW57_004597 [Staphylotrichum longicolle]|uniref:Uncharacterized protein n=1 Tax=Staphylotrichum longicolle TaxID=669026 RepID=A0AAD4F7F8_9PEZI|nr:hypothetical protein NEMBOFW57_004597 [Staphylotrichum longicolle]
MVKLALPLAALAMAASVAAVPAPAETSPAVSGTTFSFEAWVEDIIAHPDTALTVDEAIAAAEAAEARDATSCVNDLARKGGNGVQCAIAKDKYDIQMCGIGNAKIIGIKNTAPRLAVNW